MTRGRNCGSSPARDPRAVCLDENGAHSTGKPAGCGSLSGTTLPVIILDVTFRPMGLAIWRCYDGVDGDRFTIERKWWKSRHIN